MIAAESTAPPAVLAAIGSVFNNKPAEGYPGRRYHRGCEIVDELEELAVKRATELFGAGHANVQVHSGVQANVAVYAALLKPGDPVVSMSLRHGGHLSHGASASITGAFYDFKQYGVRADTELIDYDEVRDLAKEHRPKLIVAGGSSYPRDHRLRPPADDRGRGRGALARGHVAHRGPDRGRRPAEPGAPCPVRDLHDVQDAPGTARRVRPVRVRARGRDRPRRLPGHPGHAIDGPGRRALLQLQVGAGVAERVGRGGGPGAGGPERAA